MLESLGCWLKLSGGSHLPPSVPESPLVAAALDGLKVDGTFHAAVDAVSFARLLSRAPSHGRVACVMQWADGQATDTSSDFALIAPCTSC